MVEGYVKDVVTYMRDDLTAKPMSTISSITLLNSLKVRDLGSLMEKNAEIDMDNIWFQNNFWLFGSVMVFEYWLKSVGFDQENTWQQYELDN